MTTEIVPRHNNAVAAPGYNIEGMEGIGPQDVILPRYSIIQAMSKNKGEDSQVGWFWNNLAAEAVQTVFAVVLRVSRTRTLWSGDLADKSPECSSYDGVTGRTYGACATCQFAAYADPGSKYCKQGYMFLCADPESGEKFMLSAMGTSVRPAKLLISQFASKVKSPFSAVVKFNTLKVEDEKGKFWVLAPTIYKWLEPDEIGQYREQYQAMAGANIQEVDPEAVATTPLSDSDF